MADDEYQPDPRYRPYCLWLDQSPNGNTAEVWISPSKGQCGVIGKWNGRACWNLAARSVAEAERIGWDSGRSR